jgi:hypothetical protein
MPAAGFQYRLSNRGDEGDFDPGSPNSLERAFSPEMDS